MSKKTLRDWSFNQVTIRNRPSAGMVALTDLWKASDSPSSYRTDKWVKSGLVQAKLEELAAVVDGNIERDASGKISGIPGVLEIVRGGVSQGTFAAYGLALDYTEMLSEEVHRWFTSVLDARTNDDSMASGECSSSIVSFLPEDFEGKVRFTDDGRVSIYDAIGFTTGHGNPRQAWNVLVERVPEVVQKTDNFQFPGRGQRPTPIATLKSFLEILVLLPGKVAATVREKAVDTLVRAMNGDPSLAQEIIERIHDPRELASLENFIQLKQVPLEPEPGSISVPLTQAHLKKDKDIKTGFGWKNRVTEMVDLLTKLATYAGDMVIERDIPCRSFDETSKVKSRRIPLSIKVLKNLSVLHIFHFEATYIDEADVAEICQVRSYPELALQARQGDGVECVVAHLVSPGGITTAGVKRLQEMQRSFDASHPGRIRLNAMRLSELVWEFMYPTIQERYRDERGKFGSLHLGKVKQVCNELCQETREKPATVKQPVSGQLSLFGELLSGV
jgi:KilA-N domain